MAREMPSTAEQLRTVLADLLGDGRVPYIKETVGIREHHYVIDLPESQALALLDRLYHRDRGVR
jgi:hypothetical protein